MKPARSETSPTRAHRALSTAAPMITSLLLGLSCVAGGAGLVASFIEENGMGLALSTALLAVAAELFISTRPQEE